MRLFKITAALAATLACPLSARATTDVAYGQSAYFFDLADVGDSGRDKSYADAWRGWLQLHRAIEKLPSLQKELRLHPANDQAPDKKYIGPHNLSWLYQRLPDSLIQAQPSYVYILQLSVFQKPSSLRYFMKRQYPRFASRNIYENVPKDFTVNHGSEDGDAKGDPIYVLRERGKRTLRLSYGIYASPQDAQRDAAQFKKYLGYTPTTHRTWITPTLARAFIFDPIAGIRPSRD